MHNCLWDLDLSRAAYRISNSATEVAVPNTKLTTKKNRILMRFFYWIKTKVSSRYPVNFLLPILLVFVPL